MRRRHRPRDDQRARVYRAEDGVDWGRELPEEDEARTYVERITDSEAWARLGGPRMVAVADGRGRRHACAEETWYGGAVRLPRWSRRELIILHELAHVLTSDRHAAHGPEYVGHYLALVRLFLSDEREGELREAFLAAGVEWTEVAIRSPGSKEHRVVGLVRDLMALSRGTDSAAESVSAAAKAQKLLLENNLTPGDLDVTGEEDPLSEECRPFSGGKRRLPFWKQMLLEAIAQGTLCEWVTNFYSDGGERRFSFIGRASNVEIAVYLFGVIERQIEDAWERERQRRRGKGRSLRGQQASFCEGMVDTIRERLIRDRRSFEARDEECLTLLRQRGVESARERKRRYPHIGFTQRTHAGDATARESGREAGKRVAINPALGEGGSVRRLLSDGE